MSYIINKTDGSILTEIIDSAIDNTATDLTLIGKNVTGYGEFLNENFVKLLENFASTSEPNNPIAGQLWFDQTDNRLKVYDGNGFAIAAGPIVSGTPPLTPNQGDFWIDNKEKQLYFYDGTRSRYLAGKIWGDNQGKSGFEVNTLSDQFGNRRTVTYLWNAGNLLGIFSNHLEFEPRPAPAGITTIKPGFTPSSNIQDFKLHTKAQTADFLENSLGELIPAEDFLTFNQANNLTETLTISNSRPLVLGQGAETEILVNSGLTEIRNQANQDFKISNFGDPAPVFYAKVNSKKIGIFNNNPQAALDVAGDVIISGNLTVEGTTTTINTSDLSIEDKNIILASGSTTNTASDGGGITLKGTTDKTFNWVNATSSWTSSENLNLASGKSFKINNNDVLTSTTLGTGVVNSSLTSVGILSNLKVGDPSVYIEIDDNIVTTSVGTLTLSSATSIIDVSNKRITNLSDPLNDSDAVNRGYLELVTSKPWTFATTPLQFSENGDRFLVDTLSTTSTISLPGNPSPGTTVRFIDYNGSFEVNPLTIVRAREVATGTLSGTSGTLLQTFVCPTISVTGSGTGLVLQITITQASTSYLSSNTSIIVTNPGIGYKDGDQIKVLGSNLGGIDITNDLLFVLELKNILGVDEDYIVDIPNSAFSLIYTSPSQGWQYTDSVSIPPMIFADLTGNVTGNLTGNVTGNLTGNVLGNVTGDLTGSLTGNVTGNLTGDVLGDVTGNLTGDVLGDVTGDLTGNLLNCSTITAQNDLTVETVASNLKLISGNSGIRLSAYDNTGTQEQYAMQVTPGTASGNRSTTLLFGDVIISNQTGANVNGASFKLPAYTNAERDARTMSFLNYGEIIHNTDLNKIQAYLAPGSWVDLN